MPRPPPPLYSAGHRGPSTMVWLGAPDQGAMQGSVRPVGLERERDHPNNLPFQMALKESLNRFNLQRERCQASLSSIAASQASAVKSGFAPKARPSPTAIPAFRFSDNIEMLQSMHSVRETHVLKQVKDVITMLKKIVCELMFMHLLNLKTRKAFTAQQINEETYVAVDSNNEVFESLRNNLKVHYDGMCFSYKPTHGLKGKDELLSLITSFPDGLPVEEVEDAYPSVLEDLQALKCSGDIYLLFGKQDIAYPNDPRSRMKVDDDLKKLFQEIKLPSDMKDIENELRRNGHKPSTDTAGRQAAAQVQDQPLKINKTKKRKRVIKKLTNIHLPELFNGPLDSKDFI